MNPARLENRSYVKRVRSKGRVYHYLLPPVGSEADFDLPHRLSDDPVAAAEEARRIVAAGPALTHGEAPRRYLERQWRQKMDQLARAARQRSRAKTRECEVTGDMLMELLAEQRGRCVVTGLPFRFTADSRRYWRHPYAPSLDRKDVRRGYMRDNVRLVLAAVNVAMGEWGEDVFFRIARAAVRTQERP